MIVMLPLFDMDQIKYIHANKRFNYSSANIGFQDHRDPIIQSRCQFNVMIAFLPMPLTNKEKEKELLYLINPVAQRKKNSNQYKDLILQILSCEKDNRPLTKKSNKCYLLHALSVAMRISTVE